jgi:hypothetical protein
MKTMNPRRVLSLILAGGLVAVVGCSKSSVAINQAALADGEKKPAAAPDQPAPSGDAFRFPSDRGGRLLSQLLTPPPQMPGDGRPTAHPLRLPPPSSVDHPEVPLVIVGQPPLPRPGIDPRAQKLQPHSVPELAPLSNYRNEPKVPVAPYFAAGARIHLPSPNVEEAIALPILAQPGVDRVPLEDPTTDDSLSAALAAVPPVRDTPVAFTPPSLPDPFENAQTIRLKTPPAEDPTPTSATPQPPGR